VQYFVKYGASSLSGVAYFVSNSRNGDGDRKNGSHRLQPVQA
jgi:hypothetical protein